MSTFSSNISTTTTNFVKGLETPGDMVVYYSFHQTACSGDCVSKWPMKILTLRGSCGRARRFAEGVVTQCSVRKVCYQMPTHKTPTHRMPITKCLLWEMPTHKMPTHKMSIHKMPTLRNAYSQDAYSQNVYSQNAYFEKCLLTKCLFT